MVGCCKAGENRFSSARRWIRCFVVQKAAVKLGRDAAYTKVPCCLGDYRNWKSSAFFKDVLPNELDVVAELHKCKSFPKERWKIRHSL